jgi:Kef-type K+ transport system membrane component KefB
MTSQQVQLIFVDLAVIVLLARVFGRLAVRVGQPPVVGEILVGILLGPTLWNGAIPRLLFPSAVQPLLMCMADVGVAMFMFAVGLELDLAGLSGRRARSVAGAAVGSMLVPFVLGVLLAEALPSGHGGAQRASFTVFVGLSLSVTAFPVLARILNDRDLGTTALGGIALATAAVVDVVAWAALAVLQGVMAADSQHARVLLFVPFVLAMVFVLRPLLARNLLPTGRSGTVIVLTGALLSGAATEAMGMHFIFGAFLFGVVMPRQDHFSFRAELHDHTGRIADLLLPVYFVVAGLNVDLGHLTPGRFGELAAIIVVAALGKLGGGCLGARTQGLPLLAAGALAILLNTRGLTELVILGVGLQLGLIDRSLYSLMVVMALVTTAMTGPLLGWVYRRPVEELLMPEPVPQRETAGR